MAPSSMNVVECPEPGGPEALVSGERAVPEPGPGEVLIKVVAAGVNGPDLVQRRGHYPPPKGASDLLGLEVSGHVAALGAGVTGWSRGRHDLRADKRGRLRGVCGCRRHPLLADPRWRGASGRCRTARNLLHRLEQRLPRPHHRRRGTVPRPWRRRRDRFDGGPTGRGDGARGLHHGGRPEEAAFAMGLGAARTIDFREEDFVGITRDAGGADIILDIIGGDYIEKNFKAARHDARIIQLAFNAGSKVEINLMPVMLKRLSYTGSTLRSRPETFKTEVATALRETVWPLFGSGKLRPVTHTVLPLDQAAKAHALMEAAGHRGKILLTP